MAPNEHKPRPPHTTRRVEPSGEEARRGSRYGWLCAGIIVLGLTWLKSCAVIDVAPRRLPLLHKASTRAAVVLPRGTADRP